eukprot:jgi/Mesvir1/18255/Mv09528-RA.1
MATSDANQNNRDVVALQPLGVIDHAVSVTTKQLENLLGNDFQVGGSLRVDADAVQQLLVNVGDFLTKAGGGAANTLRGLSAGFSVHSHMVGACGNDDWGSIFLGTMKRAGVDTSLVRVKDGRTGRCICFIDENGQRTMRSALSNAVCLAPEQLEERDFQGAKVVLLSGYSLYTEGLLERAFAAVAKQPECKVCLRLPSFEVVRNFRRQVLSLLRMGVVHTVILNEDSAVELVRSPEDSSSGHGHDGMPNFLASASTVTPESKDAFVHAALQLLVKHCQLVVVTLAERGCIAMAAGSEEMVREEAEKGIKVVDSTGAGDLFTAGFIYSMLQDWPLRRCCQVGNLAGAAAVQVLGVEVSPDGWRWMHMRMHGELAAAVVRDSARVVHQEMLACYSLIEKLGRGVVYYGSARLKPDSIHWQPAVDLGRDVANLLGVTTWSGGGPGMMEAATLGAMAAGKKVGGIRIAREAGTTVRASSTGYLPADAQVTCRFLSSRKVALVDSGVRVTAADKTAYIILPGGLGTMDELFEILTLMQLKKLGSKHPVPLLICNYAGFYDGMMAFIKSMVAHQTVGEGEFESLVILQSNEEVLKYLANFYGL